MWIPEIQNTLENWKQDKLWNYGKRESMKDFAASKNYKVYIETKENHDMLSAKYRICDCTH